MKRRPTAWSLMGLALLALALIVLPARVIAGEAAADPCQAMTAAHHDCDDLAANPGDCLMVCAVALPAPAPQLAEPASYALRFRDTDTTRTGITLDPEHPPPR